MYKVGEEEMVICPYNRHHIVSKLRIQKHIIKCQKNHPNIILATCFYNYSHRIKPEDLLAHYEICTHKTRLDDARYSEPGTNYSASGKSDFPRRNFPNINIRTQFFCDSSFSSNMAQRNGEGNQKVESASSESDSEEFHLSSAKNVTLKSKISYPDKDNESSENDDNHENESNLEPLPLPKTVSKAFVYSEQQVNEFSSKTAVLAEPSLKKLCGRGKTFSAFLPAGKSRATDHLLPDLNGMETDLPKTEITPKFFSKNQSSSCSASHASSVFDDSITLKSEEVIFDESLHENDDNGFIFKDFDKYIKI